MAELAEVKTIRHGDPHVFSAVMGYELAESELAGERDALKDELAAAKAAAVAAFDGNALIESERDALQARIDAVRALHERLPIQPDPGDCDDPDHHEWGESTNGYDICEDCPPTGWACATCCDEDGESVHWPCLTIRALDGEAVSTDD